jgi:Alpha/beta hydrolase domain
MDGYAILRDLSDFLRRPADLFVGPVAPPCAARHVIAFGGSQTAMLLRQFYFAGLNTALASASSFDDGRVFEGSLQFVPGGRCRSLTDDSPWFSYSFAHCEGDTPEAQGKVITINAETDVQMINGWSARPGGEGDGGVGHYRVYEVAGASHIPTLFIPLKLVGLREEEAAEQNYAEMAPVLRAMADHLREWIEGGSAPPPSVFLKGRIARLATPLFSTASWGSDNALAFVTKLGEDGNALGGVRLSHVRTTLPSGVRVGGHSASTGEPNAATTPPRAPTS